MYRIDYFFIVHVTVYDIKKLENIKFIFCALSAFGIVEKI
jgi:hypothetical protein